MSGYDYGNARLRAMKGRLLSARELETLVTAGSLAGLIAALTKTALRRPVEAALARTSGMESLVKALRDELVGTLGKIRGFYDGQSGEMVAIVLRAYDVHNLKAILRGLARNAAADEILAALLPVGALDYPILAMLAGGHGPRPAIDMLASLGLPFAHPLLSLRAARPGAEVFEMELALERWHYTEALGDLRSDGDSSDRLSAALKVDADLSNLATVLRFAQNPAERDLLRERFEDGDLAHLFLGPGQLPYALLERAGYQDTVEAATALLAGTPYETPLHAGLAEYARSGRLSDMERALRRFRLAWMAGQIPKDPLGIGVVLGYVALKVNEVNNIRWIAQGINQGLPVEAIRAGVELVL